MNAILKQVQAQLNYDTVLVVVSKHRSLEEIMNYYSQGISDFGENRVQELVDKVSKLPPIRWHFIGHLQTNKVRDVVRYAHLIHSLDRIALVQALEKEAAKQSKKIDVLIQVNVAGEETKGGFAEEEVIPFLNTVDQYPHLNVRGIMCMGPHVEDEVKIREVFRKANALFHQIKQQIHNVQVSMDFLSMGMSGDYQIALQEGSNLVRIGSLLFDKQE